MNTEIIKTLEYIKTSPGCGSEKLDFNIVHDLHNMGYVEGHNTSAMRDNKYSL